jgi:phosphoglycerol transferase MdoB-like AlkP superfamily enzyme
LPRLPARAAVALRFLAVFVGLNALVRVGLLAFNGDPGLLHPGTLLPVFGIGLVFDLAAAAWWLPPLLLLLALWPAGGNWTRALRIAAGIWIGIASLVLAFVAASEFFFWNEFASRFNFIAVDYLIYTREVIGNIRESYDLRPALAGIAVLAAVILRLHWSVIRGSALAGVPTYRQRGALLLAAFALPVVSFYSTDPRYKEFSNDTPAVQLAGNGHYEFWSAFRNNEIDYAQFYGTEPLAQAYDVLRAEFEHIGPVRFKRESSMPIERDIKANGPERPLNVVLISVESLSAEFLGAFGNREGLTPNLDRLAAQGLLFSRLYATGVRTVRGLEAITLSIPPTPGNSIVKRPNNERLFTLGEVFKDRNYEPLYIYGGYGYFDNMNAFFSGNGYTVVDRTAIAAERIHHENIWGVADEDLFSLALDQLDQRHAAGRKFYAHIMTTSNHRPFTYPAGRIDIPSGTGRSGAVKYTDWAIGDFIERARSRPWFDDTVFVILADHTASGRGKTDLPIENFHIPLLFWSPKHVKPARIDTLASQIDVGPTLLAMLNFSYRSHFFGHDIVRDGPSHRRAFMANFQTVGYLQDDLHFELRPGPRWRVVDAVTGQDRSTDPAALHRLEEAVSYYESASDAYRHGTLPMHGRRDAP